MIFDDSHHWQGVAPDPSQHYGFLYEVHELDTGKLYIGKKAFWFSSGKAKRRCMDKSNPNWKDWHWKPSDWRTYTGSSKDLAKAIAEKGPDNYEFTILAQYPCSSSLRYAECNYLHRVGALTELDENGDPVYYNKAIDSIRYRPPGINYNVGQKDVD